MWEVFSGDSYMEIKYESILSALPFAILCAILSLKCFFSNQYFNLLNTVKQGLSALYVNMYVHVCPMLITAGLLW